jgi:uncharacterized protein (TIGR02453 family)
LPGILKLKTSFCMPISHLTFDFLRDLNENNSREWFNSNRKRYDAAKFELEQLVDILITETAKIQQLGPTQVKDCLFRINRDIRFSKDKSPYKNFLSAAIGPGGRNSGRMDYYLHIQPDGNSFLGGGMWAPTPAQLAMYRQEIDYNAAELRSIIEQKEFRSYFPEIWGDVMKTAPKGYPKDHPDIDLLRHKQMFFMHRYTDAEVQQADFPHQVMYGIGLVKPFCDFLNFLFFDEDQSLIQ